MSKRSDPMKGEFGLLTEAISEITFCQNRSDATAINAIAKAWTFADFFLCFDAKRSRAQRTRANKLRAQVPLIPSNRTSAARLSPPTKSMNEVVDAAGW